MVCRSLALASAVVALGLGASGCKYFQKKPAPVHGAPFVIGGEHAVWDAMWLPNGDLLGASFSELYVLTPGTPNVRRIETPIKELHGVSGAAGFVVVEDAGLAIWDATAMNVRRRFAQAQFLTLSDDGMHAGIYWCQGENCAPYVVDLATGTLGGQLESPMLQMPPQMQLSADGRYAYVSAAQDSYVADARTGKVIARRTPMGDSGQRGTLPVFRADRIVLQSSDGFEMIALPSGKTIAKTDDPFSRQDVSYYAVSDDGKRVSGSNGRELVLWDPDATPAVRRLYEVGEDRACGGVEAAIPKICTATSVTSAHYSAGRTKQCAILETATKKTVFEHPAACDFFRGEHARPGFRNDERYYGALYSGGLFAMDLKTQQIEGLGDSSPKWSLAMDRIVIADGAPMLATKPPIWLTRKIPKHTALPFDTEDRAIYTRTHRFALRHETEGMASLEAWDPAGKHVMDETVPGGSAIIASDDTAFTQTSNGDVRRCQIGKPCEKPSFGGLVTSFNQPWIGVTPKLEKQKLVNLVTNEIRPIPAACTDPRIPVTVFADASVLCAGPKSELVYVDAAGQVTPAGMPSSAVTRGVEGDFVFMALAGSPVYRFDRKTHELVRLFPEISGATVLFPDQKVEHFGSDSSLGALRCLDGGLLRPWSDCRAGFEVSGRFDVL